MNTINMQLPLGALETLRFASKDEDRESLTRIRIELAAHRSDTAKRRFTAVTADGHRLVRYSWLADSCDVFQIDGKDQAIHLDAVTTANLIKGTAKRDRVNGFQLSSDDDGVLWLANLPDFMKARVFAEDRGTFPDWRRIMPEPSTEAGRLGVSATYVGDFGRYLRAIGCSDCVAVLAHGGADGQSPVLLEGADVKSVNALRISYVVMPMRVDSDVFDRPEGTKVYKLLDVPEPKATIIKKAA